MSNFNTDFIWHELSMSGKMIVSAIVAAPAATIVSNLPYDKLRELLAEQLHSEARDEGVSLGINRSEKYDELLYVYLRKVN